MNVVSDFLLRCDRSVKITGQSGGTIIAEEKSPVKKKIVKKVKP